MRVIFMGTAPFAVASLRALLLAGYEVVAVVTQPDRPQGRGKRPAPSPVKELALDFGLDIYQPEKIKAPEAVRTIASLQPDLIVVVAYGQILPPEVLDIPPLGCINVHGSLLPRLRGAAPIQRALMNGETVSGVTTMYMDRGMDTGDIILQKEVPLPEDMDFGAIYNLLADEGAKLLLETVEQISWGSAPRVPQRHEEATYAPPLTREDERLDFNRTARELANQIRALSPEPGAFALLEGVQIKVYKATVVEEQGSGIPGQVVAADKHEGLVVQTGCGKLRLISLQRPGKRRVSDLEFIPGAGQIKGKCFDVPV